jgi:formylglycine-generating enzyme required for sulfatase activity
MRFSGLLVFIVFCCLVLNLPAQKRPMIEWVNIPAGTFTMGSPPSEVNRKADEIQHQVTLSAFKMSRYEISVAQFKDFIDATGYRTDADKGTDGYYGSYIWTGEKLEVREGVNWKCDEKGNQRPLSDYNHPVVHVSWLDARAFAEWMGGRLPTEAEWEYACRAGTSTPFNTGDNLTTSQANYDGDYPYNNNPVGIHRGKTLPVGSFASNAWGLYDMHGNVFEWCNDWYEVYPVTPQNNPIGPSTGSLKTFRGGCWELFACSCRSAQRDYTQKFRRVCFLGFRIVTTK